MNEIIKFGQYTKERRTVYMCEILKRMQGKTAAQLLEIYGTREEAPIDIYRLLKNIGINVRSIDFGEIEEEIEYAKGDILGATLIDGEEVEIFYRTGTSDNRKRFTIAHEIAHCCLHTDELKETHIQLRKVSEKDNLTEIDANIFAGELLIPQKLLMKYYEELLFPSLSSLASLFEVSTSVMAARLDYLKLSYYKDVELCVG